MPLAAMMFWLIMIMGAPYLLYPNVKIKYAKTTESHPERLLTETRCVSPSPFCDRMHIRAANPRCFEEREKGVKVAVPPSLSFL